MQSNYQQTKNSSTPSDQSAKSSQASSTKNTTKVVVFDLMNSSTSGQKGKKQSKRGKKVISSTGQTVNINPNGEVLTTPQTSSSNASLEMTPKRSRSEAPEPNSIGNVLYEVHKKLINRGRKLSPAKIQAKQQERQLKAEHLRAKIELSRKEWCKKVSQRQALARERFEQTVERKRLNLQDRLEQAARNKNAELQNVIDKARSENEKAEETQFIIKLTKQNNMLDLNHKLSVNEERRKLQLSKDMARIKGQELKREAAEKRREDQLEEMRTKLLSKEQKRDQAEQRRKEQQMVDRNKVIAEKTKRDLIRRRKNTKRPKISDIINFVSNRESLWEFIGMEQDLDSMGLQFNLSDVETTLDETGDGIHNLNESELLSMIQKDQFELEKLMLKRDHEILSACFHEQPDGSIRITKNPGQLLYRGGPKSSSSGSSFDSAEERRTSRASFGIPNSKAGGQSSGNLPDDSSKFFSPAKQVSTQIPTPDLVKGSSASELRKLKFSNKQNSQSFRSNKSSSTNQASVKSKDDLIFNDEIEESKGPASNRQVSEFSKQTVKEDKFDQKLAQQRIKTAMRRNILKRNLSEDLEWASELQSNPNFDVFRFISHGHDITQNHGNHMPIFETRSQTSSLDRNSLDDDPIGGALVSNADETPIKGTKTIKTSVAALSKKNKNKNKNQSSRSSLHSSGGINIPAGLSGGSKDLNQMTNGNKGKRNSIQDLQQNFIAKQKKTLSKSGSCSSLSSLIKTKIKQDGEEDQFADPPSMTGTLNQAQLEQLGPVIKMPINGFPFTQGMPTQYPLLPTSPNHQNQLQSSSHFEQSNMDTESTASIFSQQTATENRSFQLNSLIMSQRPFSSKGNLSSVHMMGSNLSKTANQYLFPIREQKIILMYKEGQAEYHFVQAKINVRLEETKLSPDTNASSSNTATQSNSNSQTTSSQPHLSTPQASNSTGKKAALIDTTYGEQSPATPQKGGGHSQSSGKQKDNINAMVEETKRTPTKPQGTPTKPSNKINSNNMNTPTSGKKDKSSNQKATSLGDSAEPAATKFDDDESFDSTTSQPDRMVNLIVKKLLIDQMAHIRVNESQNTILFDGDKDSQAVLKYLEVNELNFKYCRLCEVAIYSEYSATSDTESAKATSAITEHFMSKSHVRKRESFSIKENEDLAFSLLLFSSQPGEIEFELKKENEKALKRKVKKLKYSMQTLAVSHENASTYPGKELKSPNKNRLQIRCIELQKSVFPDIKFDTVDSILNDVLKVLEKRGHGDLHLMRKLKFVPTMVDMICKRITTCPKGKLGALAKVINLVIKILTKFCSLRENRNYMIQTNRLMPLIDLLSWCLNRQTELFFGIEFMPGLFHTITTHLKHRVPYECQLLKEHMVDLLISSSIPSKLKNKLAIVKSIQSNVDEDSLGQVPFFLLKSVAFLEALTAMISIDARTRPVYEKSMKIGEHVFYVLQSTEIFGIAQMITTLLLTFAETFKASNPHSVTQMLLPQTILSLAIISIKVLNNVMRMDVGVVQHMILELNEQLYHLLSFILQYAETNIDTNDDVKELLHETLIFIGYYCLLNEGNQTTLHRGENSILQKLCNLPFTYFMDKKLKEILFPTLVTASYMNERSVAIMDQEMNMSEYLVKYIETNIQEELPKIMEQEQEYFSDHTKSMSSFGRARSPSQLSTGSNSNQSVQMDFLSGNNPYLPLVMRFPKTLWKDAAQYYKSKAD